MAQNWPCAVCTALVLEGVDPCPQCGQGRPVAEPEPDDVEPETDVEPEADGNEETTQDEPETQEAD